MQLHHVVVEKVLPYRNKQREKFKEEMMEMLFAFVFVMINLLGAFVFYTSAVQEKTMEDMRMEQPRDGLIRQELISYEKEGDTLIKRTTVRIYSKDGDYQDHQMSEPI